MSGLNVTVTLLINIILLVQASVFRKEKYLQDNNQLWHRKGTYSDFVASDYPGNAKKSDLSVLTTKYVSGISKTINRNPAHLKVSEFDSTTAQLQECQNIKGLPTPESGCCGIELSRFPGRWDYFNYPTNPGYNRVRRSADSYTAPTKLIIHGRSIEPERLPWMVRVTIKPMETPQLHSPDECGGSVISSRYVLTAAHCLDGYTNLTQLEIFLADFDKNSYPVDCINRDKCVENKVMTVEQVIIHEDYNNIYLQNDVALLRLSSDIPYTRFIRPICLPEADIEDLQDKHFIVGGWGLNGQQESNLRQAAFVNYIANDECKVKYSYKDDSLFCSIGKNGEDTCHGDSGGPLMVYADNKYFLSGIVSGKRKDYECGSSMPSLFNNVYFHKKWIIKHVK